MSPRGYRLAWVCLLSAALLLETYAIWGRKAAGDTLSEYIWSRLHTSGTWGPFVLYQLIGSLTVWLVYHFAFGRPQHGGRWDLVMAVSGAIVGFCGFLVQRKRRRQRRIP